jgi:hypothetical protein
METLSIRDLRGARLRQSASLGRPLAITNHRVLVGVFVPVATAWVEHLIEVNWSHVQQSIAEGEQAIALDQTRMITPDEVISKSDRAKSGFAIAPGDDLGSSRNASNAIPLLASLAGGVVSQAPQGRRVIEELHAAFNPASPRSTVSAAAGSAEPAVRTVRIGDITADLIERAGRVGQTLAITHDRELIGMVIPVTQDLVQFLIEQNISRVLYNIGLSESHLSADEALTTADSFAEPEDFSNAVSADG